MKVKKKNGFKIATSGMATQLVINCHGGWNEDDGFTEIPPKTTVMFYTRHGDFTLGYKVVDAVKSEPKLAKVGLKKVISGNRLDEIRDKIYTVANSKKTEIHKGLKIPMDRLDDLTDGDPTTFEVRLKALETEFKLPPYVVIDMRKNMNPQKNVQDARDTELDNTCGLTDSFEGPNFMYNYALSREMDKDRKRVCDELFKNHSTGKDYHPDVDLLQIDTTKERHLSDVFAVINGMGYQFVHFGACRVPYGGTPSDVTK